MNTIKEVIARIDHLREKQSLLTYLSQNVAAFACSEDVKEEVETALKALMDGVDLEISILSDVGVKRIPKTKKRKK